MVEFVAMVEDQTIVGMVHRHYVGIAMLLLLVNKSDFKI